ncbi:cupin domain-containing protein [Rhodocytophaga rosea]|uniref:Cupin domain-containing protein n=1 Tax=Rhodocytophaga rosea TaxID=2704465 RepID=A0A6C0GBJ9_9BACT|nr:cupin domain-containing protein [Rhodocytophaga rosea]QHT65182.1 cupin domain-containing protein [Rhodocytophaga rosea]
MQKKTKIALSYTVLLLLISTLLGCSGDKTPISESTATDSAQEPLFPRGEKGPASNFTGNAYNTALLPNDSTYHTLVGNVYFEKGARSNWHVHPAGQILIVIDGEGYHQMEGEPRQLMKKGDVVKCPPNVKHWHGASEKGSLTQMYILPNTEKGIVTWLEPVTDEQYTSMNN